MILFIFSKLRIYMVLFNCISNTNCDNLIQIIFSTCVKILTAKNTH